ncbi:F-actin-monooxygenase MICAL3-like isoform X1 [Tigriopus californicus]|uniref:F-actin-monooxygenase MICAL3-like isoform X1 n=1 Tax=Tigriopus californicus TaxID=6832 RepID=UPI0027DA26A9|nr:F-actin-monooxygenase MICAL3-like isoform X1 [Tigriopus californicus]
MEVESALVPGLNGAQAATGGLSGTSLARAQSMTVDLALANEIFDRFCNATTLKFKCYRYLCEVLRVKPGPLPYFYPRLKSKLKSWKALALWTKFDKRTSHKVYKGGKACAGQRVLVIGAGPCGLRTAIEAQLLGAKVVVLEKRDRFSRNNVLHLWPYNIVDLRGLGAKKFYGKFCAGSIDHISIRQLQCILLKACLLLGVEVYESVGFEGLVEPTDSETGWKARVSPEDHPLRHYEFDLLIGADGKRNTLTGFKRKEFRGKLAIAITVNFINKRTEAESQVEEISGVAFIFNQKFFNDLNEAKGISLENIVYYKDETHYFVMTAKKHSLLEKGVLITNEADTAKLLASDNINQDALFEYAREAADFATNYHLPHLDFAVNHYGKPDVAMFDFTSMFQADNSCRVTERHGHRLLTCLVGDSLLEPFWPLGTGCARGFFGGLDACWLMKCLSSGKQGLLEAVAERESIYRILAQTTPENTCKDFSSYTVDPTTRYPNLNRKLVLPMQVVGLVDTDQPALLEEELEQLKRSPSGKLLAEEQGGSSSGRKKRRKESTASPDTLLAWFQKQLESYDCIAIHDMTFSFQNGLALCAIIHRYRPELIEFQALDPSLWAENCQFAFDVLDNDLGIPPIMTGKELAGSKNPDKLTMISYLSQVYEVFKRDIPVVKSSKLDASDDDLLDSQYRYNHHQKAPKSGRPWDKNKISIGELVANDAEANLNLRKKKRRSREEDPQSLQSFPEESSPNKENIQETQRMNRSADKKRVLKLKEKAEAGHEVKQRTRDQQQRKSIKEEERYKIIEEQFEGGSARHRRARNDNVSKYRENKKPKDLKRSIGRLDKDDWHIKNIEEKMEKERKQKTIDKGSKDKVPRWSKEAFMDKRNIIKGKLEASPDLSEEVNAKYAEVDSSLANIQRRLAEGNNLEIGERGSNRVSAICGELLHDDSGDKEFQPEHHVEKKEYVLPNPKGGGSETCHFCGKRVYVVERMSTEGKFFHRSCFKCDYCNVLLRLGSYVYQREGLFEGKFFCLPHSTEKNLEKFRYKKKTDELKDLENRQKELQRNHQTTHDWDKSSYLRSLPATHRDRLLNHDRRGSTPERVEFEASVDHISEEEVPSIMDEDEWTDRNCLQHESSKIKDGEPDDPVDTSEDSFSDLNSDTSDEEDDIMGKGNRSTKVKKSGGPEDRPLTADETRLLQKEWIKKCDLLESGTKNKKPEVDSNQSSRASRTSSESEDSSDVSSSDLDEDDSDYDGEYESTSEDESGPEENESSDGSKALKLPPKPPKRRESRQRMRRHGGAVVEESDTSTEVGSEDLSSDDDDDDDEETDSEDFDLSSGTATECEFTDSEGKPNPFHKQLEPPKIVIQPGSPLLKHLDGRVRPLLDKGKETGPKAYDPASMSIAAHYQYKTPNLSDRFRSDQQKSTITQDYSTRRALNLKKNWVSEAQTSVATKKKVDSAEIDNRLKSLMDRLSSQQKLLKPAEKPSTEMQHFLTSTSNQVPKSMLSTIKSPTAISHNAPNPGNSRPSAAYASHYRSEVEPVPVPVKDFKEVEQIIVPELKAPVAALKTGNGSTSSSNESSGSGSSHESAPEPLMDLPNHLTRNEEIQSVSVDLGPEDTVDHLQVQLANNDSGSSRDEFVSCNEEDKDGVEAAHTNLAVIDQCESVIEAVNLNVSLKSEFQTAENIDDPDSSDPKPEEITSPDLAHMKAVATSSPMDHDDIDFIDDGDVLTEPLTFKTEKPPKLSLSIQTEEINIDEQSCSPPIISKFAKEESASPVKKVFSPIAILSEDDNTGIYKESNPQQRMAKYNSVMQKENSVIHDMIRSRVPGRSVSAARRKRVAIPTSSIPPPPAHGPSSGSERDEKKPEKKLAVKPVLVAPKSPAKGEEPKVVMASKPEPTLQGQTPKEKEAKVILTNPMVVRSPPAYAKVSEDKLLKSSPAKAKEEVIVKLPDTPMTNPEKFGIPSYRPEARPEARPSRTSTKFDSPVKRGALMISPNKPNGHPQPELASPTLSSTSNDMEYMDGIVSTDESPSKSGSSSGGGGSNSGNNKKNFMKTISGIFSRSASLSSMSRTGRGGSNNHISPRVPPNNTSNSSTAINNNTKNELKAQPHQNFKFPKLAFRSSSTSRALNHAGRTARLVSPMESPGEAPRADISELGSLASLSISTSTPKREPGALFRATSWTMQTSHPSTPPIPLSRKITLGVSNAAQMHPNGSDADSLSENEENESPENSLGPCNRLPETFQGGGSHQLPPEILEKIMKRGGKSATRIARVAQLKRVRKAQEIQRQLEELDVQHKDLEERGIRAEQTLRGESLDHPLADHQNESDLMQIWFQLLAEKNRLVREEQELLIQAKLLELDDRSSCLEVELREHIMLDSRSPESVLREGEILKELLENSERREQLIALLEKDKQRYQKEDKDIEAQMLAKGLRINNPAVRKQLGYS